MYLKSIEINGFKSFANKILFEFPHGITGIVGPNGSGKSNIGDAVRWVLGEQSAKQLRGAKMEDVIFSGTQNRKPMGYAYVAITFDNADRKIALDYDEVKVARRVYRSGESEYILNGSTCRRRDIVELFYDTGIGKEGYSIIGQGQVEKILSGKIEDSRELFDEAAGIAKYKKNRSVTEKSLEQERMNLDRVTDTLLELEKRVGPLERQSVKAKEYLRLRDRAKEIDVQLFLYDHTQILKEQQELNRQHRIVSGDIADTNKIYGQIKDKNDLLQKKTEELTASQDQADDRVKELSEAEGALEQEYSRLKHEVESNDRMIEHYKELQETHQQDCENKEAGILLIDKNQTLEQEKLDAYQKQDEQAVTELEGLEDQKEELEAKISVEEQAISELLNSSFDTKEKMGRYDAMEEQLSIRRAEYNSRLIAFHSEKKEYEKRTEQIRTELESVRTDYKKAEESLEAAGNELSALEREKNDIRSRMDGYNQDFIRARSRYETLSHVAENYDGYNQSIKYVMDQKKTNPDIIGVVADILTLDQKYETAIEIALGGSLQNIVTENEQIAKKMIALLKKNRAGRATFLPLTSIRNRNINLHPDILDEIGVVGIASSLVTYDARYENLVKSLLGKTIVCDTIDNALLLAKKNHFSLRIVTLGGELLNPGGSMTGGAFKRSGNLLGRKREIEESKETMKQSQASFKKEQTSLSSLNQRMESCAKEQAKAKTVVDQFMLKLHDLENELPGLQEKKADIDASIKRLREDHEALEKQLESLQADKEQLKSEQQDTEKSQERNTDKLEALQGELENLTSQIQAQESIRNDLRLKQATSEQQIEFYRNDRIRVESELQAARESIAKDKDEQAVLKQQNLVHIRRIQQMDQELKERREAISKEEAQSESLRAQLRKAQEQKNQIFHQLEEQGEKLRLLEKDDGRITSRLDKLKEDLESKQNYMWDTYEITYNNALNAVSSLPDAFTVAGFRTEKKDLQQSIRKLGNVNVNAIEEYKEVGERYEFMKKQYDDIKLAEDKLVGMIDELNVQMREQFMNKFKEIQGAFLSVFQDLFEGGTASLELMDPDQPLECGIRIIAQPPGKKLQNILLLSGGEKALTAIALLFAIQNLKPSPFCLLDEIEAALDDANIIRFSKYLRKLSRETQFIVITHRRGTMNASDALYGITMQEKGISTLISVDLIDTEIQ